jgi:polyhydroxybutyrate depolymerase
MTKKAHRFWRLLFLAFVLGSVVVLVAIHHEVYRSDGEVTTSGKKRGYLLHVPKSYRAGQPTPLVLSFHGFGEWPAHLMRVSGWNEVADEFGFIVAYPRGSSFPLRWFSNGLRGEGRKSMEDVQFISELLDELQRKYSIDTNRVYANGLSNGGGMSCLLACRLSERIASIGSVSGAYLLPRGEWNAPRRTPVILFHGTKDPLVPLEGGPSMIFPLPFPDVPTWAHWLATNNGCNAEPIRLPDHGKASGIRYAGGTNAAEVVFYTLNGGGHTWPGGKKMPAFLVGFTPSDISATRLMWDFFQQHHLGK